MKWIYEIRQKYKVAGLLLGILIILLLSNVIERKNSNTLGDSFTSIYNDRLIPATDIFYLTESLYNKRLLLQQSLISERTQNLQDVEKKLNSYEKGIDSLIIQFEKTYLVKNEKQFLGEFKQEYLRYLEAELKVLNAIKEGKRSEGIAYFHAEGKEVFDSTIKKLQQLTQIQSEVGETILKESKSIVTTDYMLSTIEIVMAIAIGCVIQILLTGSNIALPTKQDYHLN